MARGMSHRNVEMLIGQLTTDPLLRRQFEAAPLSLLQGLKAQGFELSAVEIDALATLDAGSLRDFASAIDPRLRRVGRGHTINSNQRDTP